MSEVAETTTTAQSEEIVRSQQPGELQNVQAAYRLNGKPPTHEWGNRGGQQRPQAHMAKQPKTEENSAIGCFNNEEIEKLRSLLGSLTNLLELALWLFQVHLHSLFA